MKALTLTQIKQPLELVVKESLTPGPGEAIVQLKSAALNRRDYWITQGMYPGLELPVVLGSDGAGVVSICGEGVDSKWMDQKVLINPGLNWGDRKEAQGEDFSILGFPRNGTLATEVCVPESSLFPIPPHLDWNEAAALPLAGVTAYRAVFSQGQLKAGMKVLVTGVGGGVASVALQFAMAGGAQVWVTSSSDDKIQRAVDLGAQGGFNYRSEDWSQSVLDKVGGMDLIVDSAGGDRYSSLLAIASPGSRIVSYGATAGPPELDLFKVFWKQLRLQGSTMGSPEDFTNMLELVTQHELRPIIDYVFSLENGSDAIASMQTSPQFGKLVLSIDS